MDYYFIQGPAIKDVISSYTELTGRMEMPPLWSLGFQQSRWSYPTEKIVRSIAHGFRSRSIPCDVIYLDIDYMNGYRVFTWDKTRFPEPEKMISDLGKDGFKIIPIIDPGVKADDTYFAAREGLDQGLFAKYPDGVPYKGEVWPSWAYFPDFTLDKTRAWWGEKLAKLMAQGVAGFWIDMNEPAVWGRYVPDIVQFHDEGFKADHKKIHNVYALQMAKATREGWKKNSGKRPFVLTRAGFAGTQRYAAVWTGDNISSDEHLQLACTMPQSMGLSGLSFTGTDVGGFTGMPSANLYVRWMQLGTFTPFFRAHSIIDTPDKEPWALGETAEKLSREAITMRYRFLPFLYSEFYRSCATGLPIIRPLVLNYQDDKECYRDDAQKAFMIGDHLLVAPVLNEKETVKKLYLPEGKWMGWWDNKVYEGKRWITVDAPLSRLPLFLREGGVIALQEPLQYIGEKKLDTMEFAIFPANGASYTLYEDEGDGYGYREGAYSLTKISVKGEKESARTITLSADHDGYKGACSTYIFRVHAADKPARVSTQGKDMAKCEKEEQFGGVKQGFYYDSAKKCLVIKVAKVLPLTVSYQ
jgi:alpha-glucosidase